MLIQLKTARKCESDAKLVMEWRNDPETLKMFYHSKPKRWGFFYHEYCNEYFKDDELPPVFALFRDEKIGFLRFNKYRDDKIKGNIADMSINLCPKKRGFGFGMEIIKKGAEYLFNKGYETILAEIKQINIVSIRTFEKAGFMCLDSMDKKIKDTGKVFHIYRFILHKTKQKTFCSCSAVPGLGNGKWKMAI